MYYVYILQSTKNGRLYVGQTQDLKRRFTEHNTGKCTSTNRYKPFRLCFYEAFLAKSDAIRRERYFKTSKGKSSLRQIIRDSLHENVPR